ncbi:BspA family leucine-rich repeat surface protein [Ruminococcus albus]|uniref:Surface protein n=1 Tax=Ruminococcus albus TaxID=1264 RepID=A0A1H7QIC9_RUMAL|nr:BspA family leucine-rich repeat surface protein [Ruminococcus albus]SEL47037.1 surface protein [Ruminococcus albus]
MQVKRFLAIVMSLCMVSGAVSYGAPVISQDISAQADSVETSNYSFDEKTGVLKLKGKIDRDTIFRADFSARDVKSIIAEDGTVLPEDCSYLFCDNYRNCTFVDLTKADTSRVKNMDSMFWRCLNLTAIDLEGIDTSNVTNMSRMFAECFKLSEYDLSGLDTGNVTDMSNMFYNCYNLTELDISGFNTSKVTNMSGIFAGCSGLTILNVSGFDTSSVTSMDEMFGSCYELTDLDVSRFDTSSVTSMKNMFSYCSALTSLDVSGFDTSKVKNTAGMFMKCSGLTNLDLSNFNTKKVLNMSGMFANCSGLKTISLGENFKKIKETAELINGEGWVNSKTPLTVVSGDGKYAVIVNEGKNTYKRLPIEQENTPTYPTKINVKYSEEYHQVRFTWDKVEGADKYGIAVYLAGKWKVQDQEITSTSYTTPKSLTPGKTYKVAIAARVNGKWDTANAIKNAVTVTIK